MSKSSFAVQFFDSEGRQNLDDVLRCIRRQLKRREELRDLPLIIFTAEGEGPAKAYSVLREHRPRMIAVTFPQDFSVAVPASNDRRKPRIADEVRHFFDGVKIEVLTPPRLPLDMIDGMDGHNQQVQLIGKTIAMFGSGFGLCIQAILHACDMGRVHEGERVIAMSGDTAGVFIASKTSHFLNTVDGLQVQEIFCKPRILTISRKQRALMDGRAVKVLER